MALHGAYDAERIARGPHEVGPASPEALDFLRTADAGDGWLHPDSSNYTFVVELRCGDVQALGVYKPARGEAPLWDFPPGLYRREAAAFVLSDALGWGLVPPTVVRDGEAGEGSLQLFVPPEQGSNYFTLGEKDLGQFWPMAVFDVVANNADRKGGHCFAAADGSGLWGVDHGLTFHEEPKLRTVIWDFAGDPVPEHLLADLRELAGSLADDGSEVSSSLAPLLSEGERRMLLRRVQLLLDDPVMPRPYSRRDLPWPWL